MIINQICNAWEHESCYLPLSLYIFLSLTLVRFPLFALPNDPKINHNTSSSKGQNDDGNETLCLPQFRIATCGQGGQGRKGNVDVGRKKCSGYLLRARNIFTHVNSIKRSIMATPLPPQAFYVPHGAWPMEFVLHTLRGDSVAHSHQHQHTHTQTDKNLPRLLFAMPKDFANAARSMPPPV